MASKYAKIEEEALKPVWRERAKLSYGTVESFGEKGNISEEDVARVIKGGVDMHVHGYPDALVDTGWDFAWEAQRAYDVGMRASRVCIQTQLQWHFSSKRFWKNIFKKKTRNHARSTPTAEWS